MRTRVLLLAVAGTALAAADAAPPGMRWIPATTYAMGARDDDAQARDDERPRHRVAVSGFWLDEAEVTNERFAAFVAATGYVTSAERAPDADELRAQLPPATPLPADALKPGALVFRGCDDRACCAAAWTWVPGADWRHPEGPGSSLAGRERHPVVQVSWDDATAFAAWAHARLPTEAEWEAAARGGLAGAMYAWGDEPPQAGAHANTFQGLFPLRDDALDGFAGTSPVGSFPANGYGLVDMAGNVWEWCADWYRADAYALAGDAIDPTGPASGFDPEEPRVAKRVVRGGSFLCHPDVCSGYRVSARMRADPHAGMAHVGFRCARSP